MRAHTYTYQHIRMYDNIWQQIQFYVSDSINLNLELMDGHGLLLYGWYRVLRISM